MASGKPEQHAPNPQQIRVLVVCPQQNSRLQTLSLLQDTGYQATGVQTGSDALQLLRAQLKESGEPAFDIILKEHEPPHSNAAKFLRKLHADAVLRTVPVIVTSTYDNRDVVLKCLSLGASDYWLKPLRANEVRNLWTRVWWRKVAAGGGGAQELGRALDGSSDEASQYTKDGDEGEPTSKEGSAPDGDCPPLTAAGPHAHASGNGSSGIAGAQLHSPPGGGGGNTGACAGGGSSGAEDKPQGGGGGSDTGGGSSGEGGKAHVGSNTGGGSGGATGGNRSNGGHGAGGSGQLGSGNGASAVANGRAANDGNGVHHAASNFDNGNGSNGNGNGNHVGSNFGNGNGSGSNGNGLTTNCNMPYDASTTAKPPGPPHHHTHQHTHAHLHSHHPHVHFSRHHHTLGQPAGEVPQQGAAAAAAAAQQAQQAAAGLFQSPPPRPRMAGAAPDVRPTFVSTFGVADRNNPSATTNGNGGSSGGNGGTSAPPAAALDTAGGGGPHDRRVPTGFTEWATMHGSEPGQAALPNEVAEVAEALTSLRDSGGSPADSHGPGHKAAGHGGGAGGGGASSGRGLVAAPSRELRERRQLPPAAAAGAAGGQRTSLAGSVVKPMPVKFSRTTASDDTLLPHSRGGGHAAPPPDPRAVAAGAGAGPGAAALAAAWSDPSRDPSSMAAVPAGMTSATGSGPNLGLMPTHAHFPRGPAQMPPPLMASVQQHPTHIAHSAHSFGGSLGAPPLLAPPQQAQQHAALFGPFPQPPFGPLPPFGPPPPMGFPWGNPLDPAGQLHPSMPLAGAPAFHFPMGGPTGPYVPQTSQELAAVQQAMLANQSLGQQGYMLPYQPPLAPPHSVFAPGPWARPPGQPVGPWGALQQPGPQPGGGAAAAAAAAAAMAGGMAAAAAMGALPPGQSLGPASRAPSGVPMSGDPAAMARGGSGMLAGRPSGPSSAAGAGGPSGLEGPGQVVMSEAQSKREARQQALNKYKEKRKNLNASNKIRYQARKALAEARPRVKGQFVKVAKEQSRAEQGSNGGALTTAASPHVTICDEGAGPAGAQRAVHAGPQQPADAQQAQPMEQDGYEDEGLEYDHLEEDLGDEEGEAEGPGRSRAAGNAGGGAGGMRALTIAGTGGLQQRMAVDAVAAGGHASLRCRLQADESESATQSIGDPNQQARLAALQLQHMYPPTTAAPAGSVGTPTSAAAAAAAALAAAAAAAAAGGGAVPMECASGAEAAAGHLPLHSQHHHHKPPLHITGQKHKREAGRAAAAAAAAAAKNGSDSGSNSPGDQTPSGLGSLPQTLEAPLPLRQQ